jgi:hypothetical protein
MEPRHAASVEPSITMFFGMAFLCVAFVAALLLFVGLQ